MSGKLGDEALDIIFREARTHNAWKDEPVSDETLKALYELMKWGPTSANMSPARIIFVKSKEGKEKLAPPCRHCQCGNAHTADALRTNCDASGRLMR